VRGKSYSTHTVSPKTEGKSEYEFVEAGDEDLVIIELDLGEFFSGEPKSEALDERCILC
jgi:hypothetical protein